MWNKHNLYKQVVGAWATAVTVMALWRPHTYSTAIRSILDYVLKDVKSAYQDTWYPQVLLIAALVMCIEIQRWPGTIRTWYRDIMKYCSAMCPALFSLSWLPHRAPILLVPSSALIMRLSMRSVPAWPAFYRWGQDRAHDLPQVDQTFRFELTSTVSCTHVLKACLIPSAWESGSHPCILQKAQHFSAVHSDSGCSYACDEIHFTQLPGPVGF